MNAPSGPALTVDAIIIDDDHVLLIRRANGPFQDHWALPGGFVDVGETVEAATIREAYEETGLTIRLDELLGIYSDPARDPRRHTVSAAYLAHAGDPDPRHAHRAGDDAAEAAWFPLAAAPLLAFDHAQILEDARRRLDRSDADRSPARSL